MTTLKEILTRRPGATTIRLTVPAGGVRPAPPVEPTLGQYRLNLMALCKDFNARTQKYKADTPMAVTIMAFKDKTFEFIVKSLSVTWYLNKSAGIESGSSRSGHVPASTITLKHVYQIAKVLHKVSDLKSTSRPSLCTFSSRSFSSNPSGIDSDVSKGPVPVDHSSLLQEDEFHKLADSTIHDLLEKIEEYGDTVDIDGFDIDYGNQVLTVKFGSLGTYVLNKQMPNRQIWMSSPVSGPSRFDWDRSARAWVYRRTKEYLLKVLESELEQLCGKAINLS